MAIIRGETTIMQDDWEQSNEERAGTRLVTVTVDSLLTHNDKTRRVPPHVVGEPPFFFDIVGNPSGCMTVSFPKSIPRGLRLYELSARMR